MKTKVTVCGKQDCMHNVYGKCSIREVSLNESGKCVCFKINEYDRGNRMKRCYPDDIYPDGSNAC